MFDFAWSEIALIAAVALIAIGPKDMPVAIHTVSGMVKKARKMAAEFQTHVDDMVKEANLDEVRGHINDIRNFDIKSKIEKAIDPDGGLRDTFASDPISPYTTPLPEVTVAETPVVAPEPPKPEEPAKPIAPAFIPPALVPIPEPVVVADAMPQAPSFVPPAFVRAGPTNPR